MTSDLVTATGVGPLLRDWRRRRRLSQLDLALEAGVSARHVSFVETGRSRPSAEMVLQLAEHLDVPLRERNQMLLAAGYAPRYGEHSLDDPEMTPVRDAIQRVLDAHAPNPDGMAPRIANLAEWRAHLLERLQRQITTTGDAALVSLYDELSALPGP